MNDVNTHEIWAVGTVSKVSRISGNATNINIRSSAETAAANEVTRRTLVSALT